MARSKKYKIGSAKVWLVVLGVLAVSCIVVTVDMFLGTYGRLVTISARAYGDQYSHRAGFVGTENVSSKTNGIANTNEPPVLKQTQLESIVNMIILHGPGDRGSGIAEKVIINTAQKAQEQAKQSSFKIPIRKPVMSSVNILKQFQCNGCFAHTYRYLIDNDDVCKLNHSGQAVDILFLVLTVHRNVDARNAIRDTWLSVAKGNTANIRYVFLLGKIADERLTSLVIEESKFYKDIIQEDFKDSYVNLTLKSIMGYKWAATKCSNAKVVVKTDDDMFINIPGMMKVIQENEKDLQNSVLGSCKYNGAPHRNINSKWFASVASYTAERYPGFCSGTCYLTSMTVVQKVYNVSESMSFFHLEDVYMGLCLHKIGAKVKNVPGFNRNRIELNPCLYNSDKLITSHSLKPDMLTDIWQRQCIPH